MPNSNLISNCCLKILNLILNCC